MPAQLSEQLARAGDSFWRMATELAGQKVEAVQKSADEKVRVAEEETAQFQEENKILEGDLNRLQKEHATARQQLRELGQRLQTVSEDKARLEEFRRTGGWPGFWMMRRNPLLEPAPTFSSIR